MAPLNTEARREGHKAMESSLNAAARVRRGLKAGAPRKVPIESITAYEAFAQVTKQAGRAKDLMSKEGLDPNDVQLSLCYYQPERLGYDTWAMSKPFPAPDQIGAFFTELEKLSAESPVEYLGILWTQADREAKSGEPKMNAWVTQFKGGTNVVAMLSELRDFVVRNSKPAN